VGQPRANVLQIFAIACVLAICNSFAVCRLRLVGNGPRACSRAILLDFIMFSIPCGMEQARC